MKKITTLIFAMFLSLNALAQLEVKPNTFKEVQGFVNINLEKQNDSYEKPYAVLKIRTENIDDKQRNELIFKVKDNVEYEVEYEVGEVWLYISYFATYLQISHPELGSAEIYFPFDMIGKKGYELTLVNKQKDTTGSGILVITTKPEDGATITLNGKTLKKKTPFTNDMIAAGHYEVTVSKENFQNVTKTFEIYDGDTTYLEIKMPYTLCKLNINSNPVGATVYIDDKDCGVTPLALENVNFGAHNIRIEKNGCKNYKKTVTLTNEEVCFVVNINKCPDKASPGVFSVSPKKKVYFAVGDLCRNTEYDKNNKRKVIWGFERPLYKQDDGVMSFYGRNLFGWGESDNPKKVSKSFYELGKNVDGNWRTLSRKEWEYVLFERNTPSGIRYVHANIGGTDGIILLPDDWSETDAIDKIDWNVEIEQSGVVFLQNGEYWSSTGEAFKNDAGEGVDARCIMINNKEVVSTSVWIYGGFDPFGKKSVRLVCPAK